MKSNREKVDTSLFHYKPMGIFSGVQGQLTPQSAVRAGRNSNSHACHHYLQIEYENSSFKSSENIQKKECGSDRSVSDNQSSSVTLNKLAMKARKSYCNFKFNKEVIQ